MQQVAGLIDGSVTHMNRLEESIEFWFLVGGVIVGCAAGGWTGEEY